MIVDSKLIKGLLQVNNYFKKHSEKDSLLEPEYEVSAKIISIIQTGELNKTDLINVINIFNEMSKHPHYNGSGWHDFQIRITYILCKGGLKVSYKR